MLAKLTTLSYKINPKSISKHISANKNILIILKVSLFVHHLVNMLEVLILEKKK
jgi:hypothetical protein